MASLSDPQFESALKIGVYDSTTGLYTVEPTSTVDTVNKTVSAQINHLSLFVILQNAPASTLSNAFVRPNPYKGNIHSTNEMVFDLLTPGSQVRIYDVSGELVHDLTDTDNNGMVSWNLRTSGGEKSIERNLLLFVNRFPAGIKNQGDWV